MRSNISIENIAIVGFGSAGAAAAIQLRRYGFKVTVLERAIKIGPIGAGILIHPSGQMVLERMNLLEPLTLCAEPIHGIRVSTARGKDILNIRYDENSPGRLAYGVERTYLFSIFESAAREAGVEFCLGEEVADLENTTDGVFCRLKEGRKRGPFDLVLVADGVRSTLRSEMVHWNFCWKYAHRARWVIGRTTAVRNRLHQIVHGTKHLIGILPTGNGRASFFWGIAPGECISDFSEWKALALSLCSEAEELLAGIHSFEQMIEATYSHVFSSRVKKESTVLLGDAWHAMSPHLGQGTNLALLDGYCFAEALNKYQGKLVPTLEEFKKMRIPNNRLYATLSLGVSPFFQSNGVIKGWLRDFTLPLFGKIPWMRKHMVSSISGLKYKILSTDDLTID